MRLFKKQLAVLLSVCMVLTVMAGLFTVSVAAAESACYFLPTSAGTGSGDSFANAKALTQSDFTTALSSKEVVYIGSGTYYDGLSVIPSGTSNTPKRVIGVDTGAGKPHFYKANYAQSGKAFSIAAGTRNVVIDNFKITSFAYGVSTDGNSSNLTFRNLDIDYAVQAFALNGGGTENDTLRLDKVTIENCNMFEYTKSGIRMLNRVNNVLVSKCTADSNGEAGYQNWYNRWGGNLSSGNYWPVGFEQTGGVVLPETNITYVDCVAKGSYCPLGSDKYWNGDGFVGERGAQTNTFIRCRAYGATDGGWDSKGTNLTLIDCVAQENSKNFRFWGTADMENCISLYAHARGGSNKPYGLWFNTSGTVVNATNCTLYMDATTGANTGSGYSIQGKGGKLNMTKCVIYQPRSGRIVTGSKVTYNDCKIYDGTTPQIFMNPVTARNVHFNGDSTDMNTVGEAAGYGYSFSYMATPVTPPPFVEATPAPVKLTRDTVIYEEDFERYTSSTLSQCGWTNYGSLKSNNTKYMYIGAGANVQVTKTFAPVPLTSAGGTSPGKNVSLELSYRIQRATYNKGNWYFIGFGTSSSTGPASMAVAAASRCDDSTLASSVMFSYATSLNTGKVGSPIFLSGDNTKTTSDWVTIKYVIPVTDANGNFISSIVPKAYVNGEPDVYELGKLLNDVEKIDKILMTTQSGGGKINVDDIKVVMKQEVNFDESSLKSAAADATALYNEILPQTGSGIGQYSPESVNALKAKIDEANALLSADIASVTQTAIDTLANELYTVMDNTTPISFMYGDVNNSGAIDSTDVTVLMQAVADWTNVSYVPEACDVNKDGYVNTTDITILVQYIAGWGVQIG